MFWLAVLLVAWLLFGFKMVASQGVSVLVDAEIKKRKEEGMLVFVLSKVRQKLYIWYLVRNPVQAALRSNKKQKANIFLEYFLLDMTLRPKGSRNLF